MKNKSKNVSFEIILFVPSVFFFLKEDEDIDLIFIYGESY